MRLLARSAPWIWLATAAATAPLWWLAWPPGMDWPHHVALVEILLRLWRGEAAIAENFQFVLQPVGYHLLYAVTFPWALWLGANAALKLSMSAVLFAHVGVLHWALRHRPHARVVALVGIPAFYSAHFVWGFVVTLMATPFAAAAVLGLLASTEARTRATGAAATAGRTSAPAGLALAAWLAGVGHVVFVPFLGLASALCVAAHGRRAWRPSAAVLFGSMLAALPGAVARASAMVRAAPSTVPMAHYASVSWAARKCWQVACSFDYEWAMAGWLLLCATLLVLGGHALRHRLQQRERGAAGLRVALLALPFALLLWLPVDTAGPLGLSYLLNLRALALVPFLGAVVAADSPLWRRPGVRLGATASLAMVVALTVAGVLQLGIPYSREVEAWVAASEALPPGTRLGTASERIRIAHEWPPIRQNIGAAAFGRRIVMTNGIPTGGHLPVHERRPGAQAKLHVAADTLVRLLDGPTDEPEKQAEVWRDLDALLLQATPGPQRLARWRQRAPLLAQGEDWYLFLSPTLK